MVARALVALLLVMVPRLAAAATCDAGAACPDEDGDGFAACGCAVTSTPCDCDDGDAQVHPGAPESCDAPRDLNCTGVAPDPCPSGKGCFGSTCVPRCIPLDDFGCAVGSTFASEADSGACVCAPRDCTIFGCPPGAACDDAKTCVPSCGPDVRCPHGQLCRGFGCVDPCAEVTCPPSTACVRGVCITSCACDPGALCPPGSTCELAAPVPSCVEAPCLGIRCEAGTHCERGACIDDCDGVVCPPNQVCRKVSANGAPVRGACVDLCSPNPCKPGEACAWRTGRCSPLPLPDGGLASPPELVDPLEVAGAGWFCGTPGPVPLSGAALVALTSVLVASLVRRRLPRSR